MIPDGSKEWWAHSDAGNAFREKFVEHLRRGWWDWVEVSYGELDTKIERSNCAESSGGTSG